MRDGILRLKPIRVFCPLCGEWHNWEGKCLKSYDKFRGNQPYVYECNSAKISISTNLHMIQILIKDLPCDKIFEVEVSTYEVEYDENDPVIIIPINVKIKNEISYLKCEDCKYWKNCNFLYILGNRIGETPETLDLKFKFEFTNKEFNKYLKNFRDKSLKNSRLSLEL